MLIQKIGNAYAPNEALSLHECSFWYVHEGLKGKIRNEILRTLFTPRLRFEHTEIYRSHRENDEDMTTIES